MGDQIMYDAPVGSDVSPGASIVERGVEFEALLEDGNENAD